MLTVPPHPEAIGRAGRATRNAKRRQHRLLGEHRQLSAGYLDPHLPREAEPAAPAPGPARILAQRGALDAHGIELLDGLDGLERRHVALGPRAHGIAAVAAVEAAGAAGRILVEDEGLARTRMRAADVAVIAAALEVPRDLAVERLGEGAHHR